MPHQQKVLISGAGIAGPTLAYWLVHYGFKVVVVESAPQLRTGGQNIDVSDAAVDIVKLMGIEKTIKQQNTTEIGLQFVDAANNVKAAFPKGTETSFTSDYEILRGDLTEIIFNLSKHTADYRFGDSVESIESNDENVRVTFKSGHQESFNLFVGADGVGSHTRELIFGPQSFYKYLGVYTSYVTVPKRPTDTKWARWYNAEGGKVYLLRPDNKGTTRASINYLKDHPSPLHYSRDDAVKTIRSILRGTGWESERLFQDIDADEDIYLGPVSQVKLPRWSHGRCVFVGDAAYCPTPFTGMGTTLAVIGAYVLAGELSKNRDYSTAFDNYENLLRPFVNEIQNLPPGSPRLAYPQSKLGISVFHKVLEIVASPIVQKVLGIFVSKDKAKKRNFELPDYK